MTDPRPGISDTGRRIAGIVFPSRASTQTWMILTFVAFVGIAVVAVGLYVAFVVRTEITVTVRQSLYQQAARVASLVEAAPNEDGRAHVVREIANLSDLRISVITPDGVVIDQDSGGPVSDPELLGRPEMVDLSVGEARYAQRDEQARLMLFAAIHRADSGLIVRIGQSQPPLIALLERMQLTVVAAMLMALCLTLLGAKRVTEPLQAIRKSARAISEGNYDEPILVASRAAEFQDLADSINRMSESYQDQIVDLKRLAAIQNEFIGNVSHEVRNPIFAVGGYLEALASASLSDHQRKFYAEKGLANLERLNNLFNDLIEIARLEYREDMLKTSVFDLQELVDEVAEQLTPKSTEKNLELISNNPRHFVSADRNRIRQVLVNLIDNAIAYSDEGTVRCRFRRHLGKVRVEVVDTGRGISPDHLEHVFERFYRVDPDRSRKSGGTGLGLSIVKQILHAHGEQVHVESTPGKSTRFWFELEFVHQGQLV